jgi:hypothetical protein
MGNGNINKIHGKFDMNNLQLLAHGATVDNPIGLLFVAYSVVPCHNFKEYIHLHHDDWLDGKLTGMTLKTLMTFATCKCSYLNTKGTWEAKSPGDKKIVAMSTALNALKGHLKINDKLGDIIKSKGKGKGKGQGGDRKTKNKKNTGNKGKQKEDKVWKKVPPKAGDGKSKEVGKYTYHWCKNHMAWCMHKPSECCLGKERKVENAEDKASLHLKLRHLCRRRCFDGWPTLLDYPCHHWHSSAAGGQRRMMVQDSAHIGIYVSMRGWAILL